MPLHTRLKNLNPNGRNLCEQLGVRLMVTNIPCSWRERHIKKAFSPFGKLLRYKVMRYVSCGKIRSQGYAFVSYSTREEASAAIAALNGKNYLGRVICVTFSPHEQQREVMERQPFDRNSHDDWNPQLYEQFMNNHLGSDMRSTYEYGVARMMYYGGERPSYSDDRSVYSDERSVYGDERLMCDDKIPMYGGETSVLGGPGSCVDEGMLYDHMYSTLVISNLLPNCTERFIANLFMDYVEPSDVTFQMDNHGYRLGVAYVRIPNDSELIDMLVQFIQGCSMHVNGGEARSLRCSLLDREPARARY